MADITLSTAQTSGFIPSFWAQRALDVLRAQIVLPQLVARDVDFTQAGWKGQTITVPYPGTFAAVDKAASTPVTPQVPVGGQSIALTLSKHKVVPFLIEDFANAQANMDLMDRYMQPAVIALAEQFESDLWATIMQAGTVAALGTPGTGVNASTVRSAMKALNDAKAPAPDRALVVNTSDQGAILGDSNLQTFLAFSQPQRLINGIMGKLYGIDTFWSNLVPASAKVALGSPTAGTFTLTLGGNTTAGIAFNATAATVQAAIVTAGSVASVSGPAGGPYVVTPTGANLGQAVTGSGTGLTGGTFAVTTTNTNITFHKNAMMYAVRPFAPIDHNAGVYTAQAHDPESGLSLRITAQYDINNVGMRCNLDMLYGTTVLRANQAVPVVS